ncbi:single-stranded DNA-binding protein [uncultured Microbacterium sp.]|uniref:single-stranded DNA-binding protein n=1 Tax=uncultured Microbacterium sp. TaxID=191216 RepID=UPI0025DD584C|nr:single-stranded DNA-binding protein [uncultured Microbacterium sp.]
MTTIAIRGNLVRPIELRFTQSGKAVANATVAVNRGRDDKQETDFYEVVLWEGHAQHAVELVKGTAVIVIGRLSSRQYETKDGTKRTAWEITADAFGPDLRFQTVSVARDGAQSASPATVTDGPWATPAAAPDAWATPTPMYGDDTPF